jgi:hypothetical protein
LKKIAALSALLLALLLGYCALPLTTVSVITIELEDKSGGKITAGGRRAVFLDANGQPITELALGELPSWDNVIHWWAHSTNVESRLRPEDARRAVRAIVSAQGCAPLTLPIALRGEYVPPSLSPHGGGRAYMLYEFREVARLDCGAPAGGG